MTTGYVVLSVNAPDTPDGSGSGNASARPEGIVSSGTQTTNAPKASYTQWLFDKDADQHLMWTLIIPGDYASGGTLRLKWGSKATSGNVVWKAAVAQVTDSTTDLDSGNTVFDTVTTSTASAAPGTVGLVKESTITLTGSYTAGRLAVIMIGRDADNASDTSSNDAVLIGATLEYVTA